MRVVRHVVHDTYLPGLCGLPAFALLQLLPEGTSVLVAAGPARRLERELNAEA